MPSSAKKHQTCLLRGINNGFFQFIGARNGSRNGAGADEIHASAFGYGKNFSH
jgi:hypothetical protein